MENGSIATINYLCDGSKQMTKESVEVYCGGHIAIIDDFKTLTKFSRDKQKFKFKGQDKGHAAELEAFVSAIKKGTSTPISFEEQYISTLATCKVLESIARNQKVML